MENKAKVCKKSGYHIWTDSKGKIKGFDCITEDYDSMEVEMTCKICGATACLQGDWESEDVDELLDEEN